MRYIYIPQFISNYLFIYPVCVCVSIYVCVYVCTIFIYKRTRQIWEKKMDYLFCSLYFLILWKHPPLLPIQTLANYLATRAYIWGIFFFSLHISVKDKKYDQVCTFQKIPHYQKKTKSHQVGQPFIKVWGNSSQEKVGLAQHREKHFVYRRMNTKIWYGRGNFFPFKVLKS